MIRAVRGLGGKASQPLSENKSVLFSLPEVFPLSLFLQPFPLPNYNPQTFLLNLGDFKLCEYTVFTRSYVAA